MRRGFGPYKLLQSLLILAMLVQPVMAAGLSVQLPCDHEPATGQAHAAMDHDMHAGSVQKDASDQQTCCCDHDSGCGCDGACLQHGLSFSHALVPFTGTAVAPAIQIIPWHKQVLCLHEVAGDEFRPPRNTA